MSEIKIQCSGKAEFNPEQIQWKDSDGDGVPEQGEVTTCGKNVSPEVLACYSAFQRLVQGTRRQKISILGLDQLFGDPVNKIPDLTRRITESPAVDQFDKIIVSIRSGFTDLSAQFVYSVDIRGWRGKEFKDARRVGSRDILTAVNEAMGQLEASILPKVSTGAVVVPAGAHGSE